MTGLSEAKASLRSAMRDARAAVAPEERSRLIGAVEVRLFSVPEVHAARTVLLFYAFGSEVGTAGMADRAVRAGKRLLLPYLEGGAMEAAEVLPGDRLVPTDYGPKEPSRRVPVDPGEVDVVVTPGLAFDGVGRRLGYGKGFYDRYLRRLRPEAVRVGIGFSIQMVDEVPADPSDERVHLVVTDAEVIDCRKGRAGPL